MLFAEESTTLIGQVFDPREDVWSFAGPTRQTTFNFSDIRHYFNDETRMGFKGTMVECLKRDSLSTAYQRYLVAGLPRSSGGVPKVTPWPISAMHRSSFTWASLKVNPA
jgi:hypothetical protein